MLAVSTFVLPQIFLVSHLARLAEPGAAADRELIARKWTYPVVSKTQTNSRRTDKLPYSQSDT